MLNKTTEEVIIEAIEKLYPDKYFEISTGNYDIVLPENSDRIAKTKLNYLIAKTGDNNINIAAIDVRILVPVRISEKKTPRVLVTEALASAVADSQLIIE